MSGCGLFKPRIVKETEYVYVRVPIPVKERPVGLNLYEVEFDAVSEKNLQEYLQENSDRNGTVVFIGMDVRDYENLSLNVAEFHRYIKQQIALIEYYESQANEEIDVSDTPEEDK